MLRKSSAVKEVRNPRLRALLMVLSVLMCTCVVPPAPATATATTVITPKGEGLSEDELATLASLERIDDHLLYSMRYYGEYHAQDSTLVNRSSAPRPHPGSRPGAALLDLRERAGPKNAALAGLAAFARASGALPVEALLAVVRDDPVGKQIPQALLTADEWD